MQTPPLPTGRSSQRRSLAAVVAATLMTSTAWPQSAPPPARSSTPTAVTAADEVVTVPEFQVTSSRDRDEWFASTAMSGTRTAAPVIELPYQVQVITQEFLDDFQLVGLSEQLSFFPSYSGVADQADAAIGGTLAGSSLRGFPQTVVRDGFRRTPPPQIGTTAQVEVIKGPISTLYGDASPGGLINYVSKRPSLRPAYSVSLSTGSYDYLRSNVTASGPLIKDKLFYLISADNYYRRGEINYTYARQGDYFGTLLFKPWSGTSISATYEIVRLVGARAATLPSLVVGTRPSGTNPLNWTGGTTVGIDWRLADLRYSRFGPNERYTRDYDGLNLLVEHAYNSAWKQRIGYQGQWKGFDLNYRTNSNVSAETNRMAGVVPNKRRQDIDSPIAIQTDLLGHFATGALKHAVLFTADYSKEETHDVQLRLPTAAEAALPDFFRYQDPFHPDWTPIIDYGQLTRRASKNLETITSRGGSVSDRVAFANGRVIVMGNLRYDKAEFAEDQNAAFDKVTYGHADNWTYSAGSNVKLHGDALVAFANLSTSFDTNPTIDRNTGTTIPNEKGKGLEFGFKSLAAGGRVGFTVSGYEIRKTNIGQTNPDFILGNGLPEFLGYGEERARGIDGDATIKLSDSLALLGGAGYTDARVVASSNPALRNTRKTLVPRTTASIAARYAFSGTLKGLTAGAAHRYTGGYVRANATATRWHEEAPPKQIASAYLSYQWRHGGYTHTVRVNANNLFNKFYVGPDLNIGLQRQINLTYTLSLK